MKHGIRTCNVNTPMGTQSPMHTYRQPIVDPHCPVRVDEQKDVRRGTLVHDGVLTVDEAHIWQPHTIHHFEGLGACRDSDIW
jgi:hypothetical protein